MVLQFGLSPLFPLFLLSSLSSPSLLVRELATGSRTSQNLFWEKNGLVRGTRYSELRTRSACLELDYGMDNGSKRVKK